MTPCLLSMCVRMSGCTLTKAVSVDCTVYMLTALIHEDCDYPCEREVFWQVAFPGFRTKMIGLIPDCNL